MDTTTIGLIGMAHLAETPPVGGAVATAWFMMGVVTLAIVFAPVLVGGAFLLGQMLLNGVLRVIAWIAPCPGLPKPRGRDHE